MQALVFRGVKQIEVEEVPEPKVGSDEVLIQVAYCGICGSDLHGYLGHSARRNRSIPLVMGHEFSGRVVAWGAEAAGRFAEGQRVTVQPSIGCRVCPACRSGRDWLCPNIRIIGIEQAGGFAPLVTAPAHRVFTLPDELSDEDAALTETLAVEVHLFRQSAPSLIRSLLILGAGAQGLLALQLARLSGVPEIIVTDVVPARLRLAESMGATHVLNAKKQDVVAEVKARTGGWGVEFAIETAGLPVSRQQGVQSLAPGGSLVLIGLGEGVTTFDYLPVVARELSIRGSYCYSDDDFSRSLELLTTRQVRTEGLLTSLPLTEGPAAFASLTSDPGDKIKVLLQPH